MRAVLTALLALSCGTTPLAGQIIASGTGRAKSPTSARLIGVVPGAGHVYAGEPGRGLMFLGGMAGALALGVVVLAVDCTDELGSSDDCGSSGNDVLVAGALLGLWGWSIYDAGEAAKRTNAKRGLRVALAIAPARRPTAVAARGSALRIGLSVSRP